MLTIIFWLNAFIPGTVLGYTQQLSVGPHAGKTAVPLPKLARAWPGNTLKNLGAGYLTDQRNFSTSIAASVRMQSLVEVDVFTMATIRQVHKSSRTTEVDLSTGEETGFKVADMSRCQFIAVSPKERGSPGWFWRPPCCCKEHNTTAYRSGG